MAGRPRVRTEQEVADRKRQSSRIRRAVTYHTGTAIPRPHPPLDRARREAATASLKVWCETYFPARFNLTWCPDHLQVLARMEEAICHGGLFALAMPRGSGKSTIAEAAFLWASMTARHPFVILLAVNATRANNMLESVKMELLTNDLLDEDFNEICWAFRLLENRANRAKGQHVEGSGPTYIGWKTSEVIFPYVDRNTEDQPCDEAAGVILRVGGLTGGSIRGQNFTRPHDGKNVRPSLCLLDDPQDDGCAQSPYQVGKRHSLIHGAVLGMPEPKKKLTAIMPCTTIAPNDLSQSMLDREKSPLWTGQRYQMLARFPERMDLWDDYGTRRNDEFRNGGDGKLATAWYGQQKELMDRGAIASWPERFNADELSALQHAMNLYYLDRNSFFAEYQNDPLPVTLGDGEQLKAPALIGRVNGIAWGVCPLATSKLTAYVDVQQKCLYYVVCAWSDGFDGAIVDYGTFPDQQRPYFTLADVQKTLARATPGAGLEGSIHAGLDKLGSLLLEREWKREDGAALKIDRLVIDANWGASTDVVYNWCRRSPFAAVVMPAHGRYVGAASKPWSEYVPQPGSQLGFHWIVSAQQKRALRHLLIDTNFWKSFIAERLKAAVGDKAALSFFGQKEADGRLSVDHRLLADHLCAEYKVRTEGRGREVDEWKLRPQRPDNHWLDCCAGAACAASLLGVTLAASAPQQMAGQRKRVSFADLQRQKRET